MDKEIAAYEKHKNLKIAATELGMKWQTLYVHLKSAGIAVTGDKARYGSDKDRLASKAEGMFQGLVPEAKNQNEVAFQSKVDFIIDGKKVDVKASTLKKGAKRFNSKRWAFSVKKQELIADFIACFAFYDDSDLYKLLLIPREFIKNYQSISISEKGQSKWLEFEVDPSDVSDFFSEYVGISGSQ